MKLFFSPTSPYARKVRVVIRERGLLGSVEEIALSPYDDPAELLAANPLAKVPALVLDDGMAVFDSPVIVDALDRMEAAGPRLIAERDPARLGVLTAQALCDGILDAATAIVLERRRPAAEQSTHWPQRWAAAIDRALDRFERGLDAPAADFSLADIAMAVTMDYLDFRLSDLGFADRHRAAARWRDRIADRASFRETRPS